MKTEKLQKYPVLLVHVSGKARNGFTTGIYSGIVRVTWADGNGSEGVDIDAKTNRSPMGAWTLVG